MPEVNLDKLRRAYEAFSRGDFDEAIEIAHPAIEELRLATRLEAFLGHHRRQAFEAAGLSE